ncbi:MAG: hypothetical protein HY084_03060 [Gemmatimonadetes bacterium]|nr:hypothetical protein [Gemmatimonadota bacterium]
MLPNPLHPAVVHFPIVLMFLLPISAAATLWAIRRGWATRNAWAIPALVAGALTLSAWAALQTGQDQGEVVEKRVPERYVESHEEAAELFLILSGVVFAITAAGFVRGRAGAVIRPAATVASAALVIAGYRVGHSGGELVYKHGAAPAASAAAATAAQPVTPEERSDR